MDREGTEIGEECWSTGTWIVFNIQLMFFPLSFLSTSVLHGYKIMAYLFLPLWSSEMMYGKGKSRGLMLSEHN